jgi:hypothetical protein
MEGEIIRGLSCLVLVKPRGAGTNDSLLFLRGRVSHEGNDRLIVVNQAADKVLHDELGVLAGARGELVELGLDLRSKMHFHLPKCTTSGECWRSAQRPET